MKHKYLDVFKKITSLRSAIFCNFMLHRLIVFLRTFRCNLSVRSLRGKNRCLALENETDRLSQNEGYYQSTLRKIPEEGISDLHRRENLKSHIDYVTAHCTGPHEAGLNFIQKVKCMISAGERSQAAHLLRFIKA